MKKYDIVIIGAGLGGLVAAAILSKEGYSVCVLERSAQLGGAIQSFKRNNVVFDAGAHYVGGLDEGQNLNQIFRYLNIMDKLKITKLDNQAYDKVCFLKSSTEYGHAQGFTAFKEALQPAFPGETAALNNYIDMLKNLANDFPLFRLSHEKYLFFSKYQGISVGEYLDSLTANKNLKHVLAGNNLLYAGRQYATPLAVHGLIHYSYLESAYRFCGGTMQMAELLASEIRTNGGLVVLNAEVSRIEAKNASVQYLLLKNNERVYGDNYISNMHPSNTFKLINKDQVRKAFYNRIENLPNTISVFSLYGVFKPNSFKYLNANYYLFRENNVWGVDDYEKFTWPGMCMFFTQPEANNPEFAQGFTVLAYMKYEEVAKWEKSSIGNRGEEYLQFKENKAQKILKFIEKKFPGFIHNVQHYYTSSPLSYRDYTGSVGGSLYGVERDVNYPLNNMVLPETKINNLFLVGQNITMHGVIGVTIGALLVSSKFISMKKLVADIANA